MQMVQGLGQAAEKGAQKAEMKSAKEVVSRLEVGAGRRGRSIGGFLRWKCETWIVRVGFGRGNVMFMGGGIRGACQDIRGYW